MRNRLVFFVLAGVLGLGLATTASAERWSESKSFPVPRDGSLEVEVAFFDVKIDVYDGDEITVDSRMDYRVSDEEEFLDRYAPRYEQTDDGVVIRSRSESNWNKGWKFWKSNRVENAVMEIRVPKGIRIDVGTASGDVFFRGDAGDVMVSLDTASGDVEVTGAASRFSLDTASGDVTVDLSRPAERVNADTASGDITITGGVGEIQADTASGDIRVDGLTGAADLDTASGDVTASWTRIDGDVAVKISSASGEVRIALPRGTELDGYVDTASGDIDSDFPGHMNRDEDHMEFEGGGNAVRLVIDTASGDVEIRRS